MAEAEKRSSKDRYQPRLEIRIKDAHRFKDPEDARFYGQEAEISFRRPGVALGQSFTLGDEDIMELAIRCLQYLRDKAEGIPPPP